MGEPSRVVLVHFLYIMSRSSYRSGYFSPRMTVEVGATPCSFVQFPLTTSYAQYPANSSAAAALPTYFTAVSSSGALAKFSAVTHSSKLPWTPSLQMCAKVRSM
uniref:(northern house mosquito) hypothetical protein n=1 Tax=Culex pipiens TaxID=7175 RepID=A0A8D8I185_CULPI